MDSHSGKAHNLGYTITSPKLAPCRPCSPTGLLQLCSDQVIALSRCFSLCTHEKLAFSLLTTLSRCFTLPALISMASSISRSPASVSLRMSYLLHTVWKDKKHSNSGFYEVPLNCILLFWATGYWRLHGPSLATGSNSHLSSKIKTLGLLFWKSQLKGRVTISLNIVLINT